MRKVAHPIEPRTTVSGGEGGVGQFAGPQPSPLAVAPLAGGSQSPTASPLLPPATASPVGVEDRVSLALQIARARAAASAASATTPLSSLSSPPGLPPHSFSTPSPPLPRSAYEDEYAIGRAPLRVMVDQSQVKNNVISNAQAGLYPQHQLQQRPLTHDRVQLVHGELDSARSNPLPPASSPSSSHPPPPPALPQQQQLPPPPPSASVKKQQEQPELDTSKTIEEIEVRESNDDNTLSNGNVLSSARGHSVPSSGSVMEKDAPLDELSGIRAKYGIGNDSDLPADEYDHIFKKSGLPPTVYSREKRKERFRRSQLQQQEQQQKKKQLPAITVVRTDPIRGITQFVPIKVGDDSGSYASVSPSSVADISSLAVAGGSVSTGGVGGGGLSNPDAASVSGVASLSGSLQYSECTKDDLLEHKSIAARSRASAASRKSISAASRTSSNTVEEPRGIAILSTIFGVDGRNSSSSPAGSGLGVGVGVGDGGAGGEVSVGNVPRVGNGTQMSTEAALANTKSTDVSTENSSLPYSPGENNGSNNVNGVGVTLDGASMLSSLMSAVGVSSAGDGGGNGAPGGTRAKTAAKAENGNERTPNSEPDGLSSFLMSAVESTTATTKTGATDKNTKTGEASWAGRNDDENKGGSDAPRANGTDDNGVFSSIMAVMNSATATGSMKDKGNDNCKEDIKTTDVLKTSSDKDVQEREGKGEKGGDGAKEVGIGVGVITSIMSAVGNARIAAATAAANAEKDGVGDRDYSEKEGDGEDTSERTDVEDTTPGGDEGVVAGGGHDVISALISDAAQEGNYILESTKRWVDEANGTTPDEKNSNETSNGGQQDERSAYFSFADNNKVKKDTKDDEDDPRISQHSGASRGGEEGNAKSSSFKYTRVKSENTKAERKGSSKSKKKKKGGSGFCEAMGFWEIINDFFAEENNKGHGKNGETFDDDDDETQHTDKYDYKDKDRYKYKDRSRHGGGGYNSFGSRSRQKRIDDDDSILTDDWSQYDDDRSYITDITDPVIRTKANQSVPASASTASPVPIPASNIRNSGDSGQREGGEGEREKARSEPKERSTAVTYDTTADVDEPALTGDHNGGVKCHEPVSERVTEKVPSPSPQHALPPKEQACNDSSVNDDQAGADAAAGAAPVTSAEPAEPIDANGVFGTRGGLMQRGTVGGGGGPPSIVGPSTTVAQSMGSMKPRQQAEAPVDEKVMEAQFIEEIIGDGIILTWHSPHSMENNLLPPSIALKLEVPPPPEKKDDLNRDEGYSFFHPPRLTWSVVNGDERDYGGLDDDFKPNSMKKTTGDGIRLNGGSIGLFDVESVQAALSTDRRRTLHLSSHFVPPANSFYITTRTDVGRNVTSPSSSSFLFQAKSGLEQRRIIWGLKRMLSRIAFDVVAGKGRDAFFLHAQENDNDDDHGDGQSYLMRAMDGLAISLVDESRLIVSSLGGGHVPVE